MANLRASLLITFLSTNGATAVQLVVTIVLARLLAPEEIGVYSITAVLVSTAHIFRDFGVASYLQREKDLTRDAVGAAFGVLLTSSWLIALLLFLVSGTAAAFFNQPGVRDVMQVLALGFVFVPFGAITHSLLTRDYRAREQVYAYVAGTTAYAVTAIGLALLGFGYMSMAWANLVNIIATALAYIPFRPAVAPWLPRFRGWRKVVNFGAGAVLGNSLQMVNNALPDLVLGKLSGPHDVGIMSRSISTPNMLNQVLGPTVNYAVLPFLSRTHHAGEPLSVPLTRGMSYLTTLMWPALAVTFVYAEPIVLFLYGAQWLECVPLIRQLCLALALGVPFTFNNAAYMAIGRPYLTSLPTAVDIGAKALAVVLLYDGTLARFAWALVSASVLMVPLHALLLNRLLGLPLRAFLAAQSHSLLVAGLCLLTALLLRPLTRGTPPFVEVLVIALAMPPVWLAGLRLARAPLLDEVRRAAMRFPAAARWLGAPRP